GRGQRSAIGPGRPVPGAVPRGGPHRLGRRARRADPGARAAAGRPAGRRADRAAPGPPAGERAGHHPGPEHRPVGRAGRRRHGDAPRPGAGRPGRPAPAGHRRGPGRADRRRRAAPGPAVGRPAAGHPGRHLRCARPGGDPHRDGARRRGRGAGDRPLRRHGPRAGRGDLEVPLDAGGGDRHPARAGGPARGRDRPGHRGPRTVPL
ncbi:MAG: Chemotaxis response regulator protein-glutamate methylesterase CheB, partial [uncultured Corynebacteriales bacterium]